MNALSKESIIISGPNGAGKTTFAKAYLKEYAYEYLNPDDTAVELNPDKPEKAGIYAGRLFLRKLETLIGQGKNLLIESTLSGRSFQQIIKKMKQAGYIITIIYIFLDTPATCFARVKERVRNGGHNVPEPDIVRRFYRSKANFWQIYRNEADLWHLFYNSNEYFLSVAFGEKVSYTTNDEALFKLFIQDIKESI